MEIKKIGFYLMVLVEGDVVDALMKMKLLENELY